MATRSTILFGLILSALLCSFHAIASYVTPQQALSRLDKSVTCRIAAASSDKASHISTIGDLYVFRSADGGFLILPDDDRAPALLGYSDNGQFDIEGNPALKGWLDYYNRELQYLKTTHEARPQNASSGVAAEKAATRQAIAPLIKTEWNQEAPYNMLCPKVNGHDVVTGCVATAMAQFMKYYDYPAKGKGTHSYYWEVGAETLSLDYDTIPFQWDLMTDTYDAKSTEAAKRAVAQLMVACGISVDMHYDIGDSGAATTKMGAQLISTFGYSPSLWMAQRDYYGYDEWVAMIYDELSHGRPVLYSGQGTAGGHQFICDGYQADDYFHFNWGWGGLSNGYFLLTALNPDDLGVGGGAGGFNSSQIATIGARPSQTGDEPTYLMYNSNAFTPEASSVSVGDDFECSGVYFNFSMSALPNASALGMKFTNDATGAVTYVRGPEVGGMKPDEGRYYDIIKFPDLADGTYTITPALHAGDKWWAVRMPLGNPESISATVANGIATFAEASEATIEIRDITLPKAVYVGHDFPMQFSAYNASTLEYYGKVTPYLFDSTGSAVAASDYRPLDVMAASTERVSDYVANFAAVDGATFDAGEYQLVFCDADGNEVSSPVSVTFLTTDAATTIAVSDFRLVTTSPVTDPAKVEFAFTLTCETGVYNGCPRVIIFPGDGGYEQAALSGDSHYLGAGESVAVTISGSLDSLKDGGYMAAAYDDGEARTDYIRFEIKRPAISLDSVECDGGLTTKEIFDLRGLRHATPLSPGIYIIDGRTVLVR